MIAPKTRQELVDAGARIAAAGMSPGSSGNISMREGDRVVMSPTGADLAALRADELSVLDLGGTLLSGPRPSKEFPFHRAFYRRAPATAAVVHVHSLKATAVSCTPPWSAHSAVPPLTPYFVMRVGQTPLIPYADPGDAAQADAIEALRFPFRAALLQNHGSIAAGTTIHEAVETAVELEQTCAVLLSLGEKRFQPLEAAAVSRLAERYSSPWT
ncbi:class II aldolase [Streptomyces sulfonofaciens]|uniref:Class II aldolase n=1 Tax=Streptomyces sulfonofaciens TaxID=68272 RepID=A0A919FV69_9ACTN|nr:class II aldolase/adducin family protein [Streptomyces sulfonofaciens]GHH72494.1 class II aldolase [Streptomyces sulfonofaciens]